MLQYATVFDSFQKAGITKDKKNKEILPMEELAYMLL
jgi:hypothetical protein